MPKAFRSLKLPISLEVMTPKSHAGVNGLVVRFEAWRFRAILFWKQRQLDVKNPPLQWNQTGVALSLTPGKIPRKFVWKMSVDPVSIYDITTDKWWHPPSTNAKNV